ncbi:hypothetical protein R3P38DRAFT_1678274 [Favolaschia claudopus]|uniref:Uncharacterized protein n=1 Tax=Favolaschia claudopus TaxID=2862362 RepID=A0AAW0AED8_9AGAR
MAPPDIVARTGPLAALCLIFLYVAYGNPMGWISVVVLVYFLARVWIGQPTFDRSVSTSSLKCCFGRPNIRSQNHKEAE